MNGALLIKLADKYIDRLAAPEMALRPDYKVGMDMMDSMPGRLLTYLVFLI